MIVLHFCWFRNLEPFGNATRLLLFQASQQFTNIAPNNEAAFDLVQQSFLPILQVLQGFLTANQADVSSSSESVDALSAVNKAIVILNATDPLHPLTFKSSVQTVQDTVQPLVNSLQATKQSLATGTLSGLDGSRSQGNWDHSRNTGAVVAAINNKDGNSLPYDRYHRSFSAIDCACVWRRSISKYGHSSV